MNNRKLNSTKNMAESDDLDLTDIIFSLLKIKEKLDKEDSKYSQIFRKIIGELLTIKKKRHRESTVEVFEAVQASEETPEVVHFVLTKEKKNLPKSYSLI